VIAEIVFATLMSILQSTPGARSPRGVGAGIYFPKWPAGIMLRPQSPRHLLTIDVAESVRTFSRTALCINSETVADVIK
jgi:hypothetical protein